MADGVLLNRPSVAGGQTIVTEDVGGGLELPAGKIYTGAHGTNGGPVTVTNPLPVELSDGTNPLGVSANPLQVAGTVTSTPSGTQTVAGTVAVSSVAGTVAVSAASLPLPTGAAQDATITARLGTLGQKASAGSAPVVIASDQSAVPVTQVGADGTNSVEATVNKPLSVATYCPSFYAGLASSSGVVKASPGNLFSLQAVNRSSVVTYVQLFNSASAPAGGAGAFAQFMIPPLGEIIVDAGFFTVNGIHFSTGIAWGISTTNGTYTAATASQCDFQAVAA